MRYAKTRPRERTGRSSPLRKRPVYNRHVGWLECVRAAGRYAASLRTRPRCPDTNKNLAILNILPAPRADEAVAFTFMPR